MHATLAIIIPAYKSQFLRQALESLAGQSCHDFHVYIGNDAGDAEIGPIVDEFKSQLHIEYVRFEENLGKTNLVAHWTRCLEMVREEEWIWLFSDDDTVDSSCVSEFLKTVKISPNCDVFRFDICVIDAAGSIIHNNKSVQSRLNGQKFLEHKMSGSWKSYAIEFIVRRSTLIIAGGFAHFDMAWHSDDMTIFKCSEHGIQWIPNAKVYWRESNANLTPNVSPELVKRKIAADQQYIVELLQNNDKIKPSTIFRLKVLRWYISSLARYAAATSSHNFNLRSEIRPMLKMIALPASGLFAPLYFEIKRMYHKTRMRTKEIFARPV